MMLLRFLKWMALAIATLAVIAIIFILVFDWNWLRAPASHRVAQSTGRELVINGNLKVTLGWPLLHVRAEQVSFGNPEWAKEKYMLTADEVEFSLGLPQLLKKNFDVYDIRLVRPVVNLQVSPDGRKNWLLDKEQKDESSRIQIGRLTLDHGQVSFDDPRRKTHLAVDVSTQDVVNNGSTQTGVVFAAKGRYQGMPLKARGTGGSVLALNDETLPYPFNVDASIGHTAIQADGTITGLTTLAQVDMQLALRGDSLAEVYPLLGIALPETHAYHTKGHVLHHAKTWRYEKFSGQIGASDLAGTLQVDTDAKRPYLRGQVVSQLLDITDLGPVIGAQQTMPASAKLRSEPSAPTAAVGANAAPSQVLPDIPFRTERWRSVDADVKLRAKTIRRAKALPLEDFTAHLKMQDAVLTLDPLNFGVADGTLASTIVLDGQRDPIQARAKIHIRKILLKKLFPTIKLTKTSIGEINGEVDLEGNGNSVGRMLGTSNGKFALVVAGGEISKLMMEMAGLHLWDMLKLKITGDQVIPIRCGVAEFNVKSGVMAADVFILDTTITTLNMSGTISLRDEKLDLELNPKTKKTSVIALRGPIYIHGTFSDPRAEIDTRRVAARSLGAVALGVINPFLAILPLVETGPGMDSDCGRLIHDALQPAPGGTYKNAPAPTPPPAPPPNP
ncbi:MAG: AsmA family protein, partial [Gammaproteobacteria bacterium]